MLSRKCFHPDPWENGLIWTSIYFSKRVRFNRKNKTLSRFTTTYCCIFWGGCLTQSSSCFPFGNSQPVFPAAIAVQVMAHGAIPKRLGLHLKVFRKGIFFYLLERKKWTTLPLENRCSANHVHCTLQWHSGATSNAQNWFVALPPSWK